MVKGVTEDEGMGAVKREETRWFLVYFFIKSGD